MHVYEIREPELARRHVLQGLAMLRTAPLDAESLKRTLPWALELAGSGEPLPPIGFIADVGNVALGLETDPAHRDGLPTPPGFDHRLVRRYDDYVLGKLYADLTFERGADALLRYQGRDRIRGLAFLVEQFRRRAGFGGVLLSPAVVKSLRSEQPEQLLAENAASIAQHGLSESLLDDYDELISAVHNLGEVLGAEDIFELEHGTALADFGQRLALRQILQAAEELERELPRHKIRLTAGRRQVATRILDEDIYPVGGFTSISNRGTIESLLHSQLAYMERDDRPDLFDIKFLRDELLYYSRDENQFLRRRQSFLFALDVSLVQARFKDAELPWQRIVLVLATLLTAVRKLTDWLSHDALTFEFLLLDPAQLAAEEELLTTLFREQIASGLVRIEHAAPQQVSIRCRELTRRSVCNCLLVGMERKAIDGGEAAVDHLLPHRAVPQIIVDDAIVSPPDAAPPLDAWREGLLRLLQAWIR